MKFLLPATFIVFLTMKLMGYITWSWWIVFAPLYPIILVWVLMIISAAIVIASK